MVLRVICVSFIRIALKDKNVPSMRRLDRISNILAP